MWRRVKSEVPSGGLSVTPSALGLTPGSRQRCVWLQGGRATCPDTDPLGLLKSEEGELRGIPPSSSQQLSAVMGSGGTAAKKAKTPTLLALTS